MIYVVKAQAFLRTPLVSMIVEGEDWMVGFDDVFSEMPDGSVADFVALNNYPISRLIVHDSNCYQIQLELGAFEGIKPRVDLEEQKLIVAGDKTEYARKQNENYLQKGISARGFRRSFELGANSKVTDTNLQHGILQIDIDQTESISIPVSIDSESKLAQAG